MWGLNPDIRILICTGYPFDVASLPPAIHSQAALLHKPFSPRDLAEAVEQVLMGRGGSAPAASGE
jgi:hypothetical protein